MPRNEGAALADVVQRWRIVYRRGPGARGMAQRAETEAWAAALTASALPVAGAPDRVQPGLATPLPVGLEGDAERLDLPLARRMTRADVRAALEPVMPPDHRLLDVHDVWIGEPPLVGRVIAADYRLEVVIAQAGGAADGPGCSDERGADDGLGVPDAADGSDGPADRPSRGLAPAVALAEAAAALLDAATLPRVRRRGDREIAYDLRPFLLDLAVSEGGRTGCGEQPDAVPRPGRPIVVVRCRLRVDPTAGTGRPDEVLAALAEALGRPLELARGTRERLWLADETDEPGWGAFDHG